jgi:hypothetical protein
MLCQRARSCRGCRRRLLRWRHGLPLIAQMRNI